MPFDAGSRFGPYELIAPLGAGGMGEVYRARDTRLERTVAIKVLTGALAADAESRRRFEHEARAIAALNDPHLHHPRHRPPRRARLPGARVSTAKHSPLAALDVKLLDFGLASRTTATRP